MTNINHFYLDLLTKSESLKVSSNAILKDKEGIVLFGAGRVGHEFLEALRRSNIPVLAFADNNSNIWNQCLFDIDVLSPKDAAMLYGKKAHFIITIGRIGEEVSKLKVQLESSGIDIISHFVDTIQLLPSIWPTYFLNPTEFVASNVDDVAYAFNLLNDDLSRSLFLSHLRWRMTIENLSLPTPSYDNQYFPKDIIMPAFCQSFVDVGAYIGDTLSDLMSFASHDVKFYYGYEPDVFNYVNLKEMASKISLSTSAKIVAENLAIGEQDTLLSINNSGYSTSQIIKDGDKSVICRRLDSLDIDNPTYIKVDTEGFGDSVISGSLITITNHRPCLAIACYHKPKDLFYLIIKIHSIYSGYRFYLRSHGDAGVDLVLYAIPH